jgi:hypothetical protein
MDGQRTVVKHYLLGSTVAEYTGNVLHHKVRSSPYFDKKEYRLALKDAFLTIDQDLKEGNRRAKRERERDGRTGR